MVRLPEQLESSVTRNVDFDCYEDCASLPIWNNPYIVKQNGDTLQRYNYKYKRGCLYHVGQLYSNYSVTKYKTTSQICLGHLMTKEQLFAKYALPLDQGKGILEAMANSPLHNICCKSLLH